jgi:tetratricopeptide (TPR) repeat protein
MSKMNKRYHNGHAEVQIVTLTDELVRNPRDVRKINKLLNLYIRHRRYESRIIEQLIEQGLKIENDNVYILCSAGNYHNKIRNYKESIVYYEHALKINPRNEVALNSLGQVYLNQGNYDQAETQFNQTLKINPRNEVALNSLGQVYLNQGKYDQAETQFNQTLKINPRDEVALFLKGIVLVKEENYESALGYFEKRWVINDKFKQMNNILRSKNRELIQRKTEEFLNDMEILNSPLNRRIMSSVYNNDYRLEPINQQTADAVLSPYKDKNR